jgi:hypothetical protein
MLPEPPEKLQGELYLEPAPDDSGNDNAAIYE